MLAYLSGTSIDVSLSNLLSGYGTSVYLAAGLKSTLAGRPNLVVNLVYIKQQLVLMGTIAIEPRCVDHVFGRFNRVYDPKSKLREV